MDLDQRLILGLTVVEDLPDEIGLMEVTRTRDVDPSSDRAVPDTLHAIMAEL